MNAIAVVGPLLLGLGLVLFAAWLTTGSRARRIAGVATALLILLPPWLVPVDHSSVRAIWAITAFAGVMRVVDLRGGQWRVEERIAHVLSIVDTRRLERAPPRFELSGFGGALAWEAMGLVSYLGLEHFREPISVASWAGRWVSGLGFVYAVSEGSYRLVSILYRAVGFVTPALHILPAASRSVQEFWGTRWNRIVSAWLGETCFRPLARRRHPLLGALFAFAVSAIFHAYIVWVSVGRAMAAVMLAYFLLQGALLVTERVLRVRAWRRWAGYAWTWFWMVALSPGFVEPMVRALGA